MNDWEYIANFDLDEILIPVNEYSVEEFVKVLQRQMPQLESFMLEQDIFANFGVANRKL
jgi:hypothetical protein